MVRYKFHKHLSTCITNTGKHKSIFYLGLALANEKLDLEKKYQSKVDDLEAKLVKERQNILAEREELHLSIHKEKRLWDRGRDSVREELEEEIAQNIQRQLEVSILRI